MKKLGSPFHKHLLSSRPNIQPPLVIIAFLSSTLAILKPHSNMGLSRLLLQTYQILSDPNPNPAESPTANSTDSKIAAAIPNKNQNQRFDSSMGLTTLVLLSALLFISFFSIYIRRFAHDSPAELSSTRRRLRSGLPNSTATVTLPNVTRLCNGTRKGLDFDSIQSLPVVNFSSTDLEAVGDCCAVCLGEFDEGESVKMLPTCQHLFHVECIDTWLVATASCPLCRTTDIFNEEKAEVVADVTEASGGGARRCCSCSEIDEVVLVVAESGSDEGRRGGLQRTRSF